MCQKTENWNNIYRLKHYMCIKPVLGESQNESLFLEKSQMISLLLCDTLDNVLFLALGTARFCNCRGNNTLRHAHRQPHTHFSTHLCSGLTFPCTLPCPLHSFEIALPWLVDVAAHKMTATSPKAGGLFSCWESSFSFCGLNTVTNRQETDTWSSWVS